MSRSTVLRLVEELPDPVPPTPRVVGVDEYATRKGRVYGTVLVDAETRRPVDLLPDREASSLAAWLAERPGIEVVCWDRAPFFAEGATVGAPLAVQVADRWHLWHNLSEAAERAVARHRQCLRAATPVSGQAVTTEPVAQEEDSDQPWPRGFRFADRTRARHAAVHALLAAGHSRRAVQRQLGMTWRTVKAPADAETPEDLFQGQWQNRRSVLDDCKPYLDDRWSQGCTNAWKLWEEIVPLGYKGSYQRVQAYLRAQTHLAAASDRTAAAPHRRMLACDVRCTGPTPHNAAASSRSATTSSPASPKPSVRAGSARSKDSRSASPVPRISSPRSTGVPSNEPSSVSAPPRPGATASEHRFRSKGT
ncbi:transposase [Kitasatospora purpeofusca]|uniref:transposase n=1 Tax=Kitasatospora purpeofusca TaxID=67352 RepID=UPI0033D5DE38